MNEYVEDLMLQIAEKNMIINSIHAGGYCRFDQVKRLTCELDCLLYEFYKSMIYYKQGR